MLRIFRSPFVSGPVSLIVLFSFLLMTSGCTYFRVNKSPEPPANTITKMQDKNKFMILHLNDKAWQINDIIVAEDTITGKLSKLIGHDRYLTAKPDRPNRYKSRGEYSESYLLNEVHIYTTGFSETGDNKVAIPVKSIERIEVYDSATGANIATFVLGTAAVAATAFGILLIIIALTKSSCPFVYTNDGSGFLFTGEIFSGATQPGLQRDDYMLLPRIGLADGTYKIRLTNEVNEVQSIDYAGIIVADHSVNTSVLIDKYGKIHSVQRLSLPLTARNGTGIDISNVLKSKDSLNYSGDMSIKKGNGIETIYLTFLKPQKAESAKLVIRAKNTFWLDILFTKFHKLFGSRYKDFTAKQESASPDKLKKFLLDQNIPLSVYIKKDSRWQLCDYFNIAGPMALRDDILPIDLSSINSDTVEIKLETGFLFWELDYAGMDFSNDEEVVTYSLRPDQAVSGSGDDVSNLLASRDKNYLVLKEVGDEVSLVFNEPSQQNAERSIFLHTSGYYKIVRDLNGPADKKALKTFMKPNRFPEFSREIYDQLPNK
ncbi:MAG: hypothetical protein Q8868_13610 [Bacteroidota bacterium]|nr:hypothetical protein [Bacteroidota bacterium]